MPPLLPASRRALRAGAWLLGGLSVAALIWAVTLSRCHAERERSVAAAVHQSAALADAYERYLTRSIAQIDQISMQLKQSWEEARNPALLNGMRAAGMFSDGTFRDVRIVGRDGQVVSTVSSAPNVVLDAASPAFQQHAHSISSALRISVALIDGQALVLFTRRLDTRDDDFDGVVSLAVDPRYLTDFFGISAIGPSGRVGVFTDAHAEELVQHAGKLELLSGAQRVAADVGLDADQVDLSPVGRTATLVTSRRGPYPLHGFVALARQDVIAQADAYARRMQMSAGLLSACILALTGAASVASARAATRRREHAEISRAYRTATEGAADGFYMAQPVRDRSNQIINFKIVDCNERGAAFYGLTAASLIGRRLSELDPTLLGEHPVEIYRRAMEVGFLEDEREMPREGQTTLAWGRRRLVRVGNGLAVTLRDVSAEKAHQAQLQRLANEDPLTSLPNRHWFLTQMPGLLDDARRDGRGLAMLFIDLDDFKQVNDTQGHLIGDQVLRAAAQRLRTLLRPTDHIARFGGDEFVLLLHAQDEAQIAAVAERVVRAFDRPFAFGAEVQTVGASVGISLFPRDGEDPTTLVKHSDIAMYAAKSGGRGQFRFFDPALFAALSQRAQLKARLAEAVQHDQFFLQFQPRIDTLSGRMVSMEALLRWRQPALGLVSPADFVPLAEETGLIVPLGQLVIEKACGQIAGWRRGGLTTVSVSINVSPVQLTQGGVAASLGSALRRYGLAASELEVELTESAMIGDQPGVLAELDAIRALGCRLYVDDFGTGYSSLSQLQRLRMDGLKVDRAFTVELDRSPEGRVFFQAIVSMAHALGMVVVAEGVETATQLDILRGLGCDEAQGFLIARPLEAEQMTKMLVQRMLASDAAVV